MQSVNESTLGNNTIGYGEGEIDYGQLPSTPEDYRRSLIRLMSIQAFSELKAATEPHEWIEAAPDYRRRKMFTRVLAEEAHHSFLIYRILERIGISEAEANDIAEGKSEVKMHASSLEGPLSVGDSENEWIDIMLNHFFLDRAGKFMVGNFCSASFKPWADANKEILQEELGHIGLGQSELSRYMAENPDPVILKRKIISWYAKGLNFFGPPSKSKSQKLKEYGLKRLDNEELRAQFIREVETFFRDIDRMDLLELNQNFFPYN